MLLRLGAQAYQLLLDSLDIHKSSEEIKTLESEWYNQVLYSEKDRVRESKFNDIPYTLWKVKVFTTSRTEKYIRLKHKISGNEETLMAKGDKPCQHSGITEAEWFICAAYAENRDQACVPAMQAMIKRISHNF